MAHTTRNKKETGEVLRVSKPYKRSPHSELLKEFELSYIRVNQDPTITL